MKTISHRLLIILKVTTLVVLAGWLSYRLAFKLAGGLPETTKNKLLQIQFELQAGVNDVADFFYFKTHLQGSKTKDLTRLNLLLSTNDMQKIEQDEQLSMSRGYHDKQLANEQQISLIYNQEEIPARISLHGGGANNYIFDKTDYDVELRKDNQINGISDFTLFNPAIHHWVVPMLANQLAENLNLFYSDQYPVVVEINNRSAGIYLFEEKINSQFLNSRDLEGVIVKLKDETRLPHRVNTVALNAHHLSGLDFEIANVDLIPEDETVRFKLYQLFQEIKAQNSQRIATFFDLDYLARYEAYRQFLGIDHDAAGDNQRFIYLNSTQKFYPVVRSEGDLTSLSIQGGTSLKSYNQYDPHLADQYDYPRLSLLLHRLSEFRQLKYQYLNQLVNQQPQIFDQFKQIYQNEGEIFIYDTADEASVREKKKKFANNLSVINHNLNLIKQELNYAAIVVNVINYPGSVTIEVVPDSVMPITIERLELELANGQTVEVAEQWQDKIILAEFSDDYDLLPTVFSASIPVSGKAVSVNLEARNAVTGEIIDNAHWAIATE